MRKKTPHVASLDEVKITRDGETAVIEYDDRSVATVHLKIGASVQTMTDEEILAVHNDILLAQARQLSEYEYVATEIPEGLPQIRYEERCQQWVPRGSVLRCQVSDGGPDGEATIYIDDHELSLEEFGGLLTAYAGWGMRVVFVPRDETGRHPPIEVRDVGDGEPVCGLRPRDAGEQCGATS
ncbi:MAG: hypothetical protein ISS72_06840 [Candidatus Brocadiae bacterium]|nr:hypothetical protein [Candidatus Brocadiia bacterium]